MQNQIRKGALLNKVFHAHTVLKHSPPSTDSDITSGTFTNWLTSQVIYHDENMFGTLVPNNNGQDEPIIENWEDILKTHTESMHGGVQYSCKHCE